MIKDLIHSVRLQCSYNGFKMVHFGALGDLARRELTEYLDKYTGKKVSTVSVQLLYIGPVEN